MNFFKNGKNITESNLSGHGVECSGELHLIKSDGTPIEIFTRIIPGVRADNTNIFCAFILTAAKDKEARSLSLQSAKERSAFLLCASSHFHTFTGQGSLFSRYEKAIVESKSPCELQKILDKLFELIDPIINPKIEIKIDLNSNITLPIRESDGLRLVGLLVLIASDYLASAGAINISVKNNNSLLIKAFSPKLIETEPTKEFITRALHPVSPETFKYNQNEALRIAQEYKLLLQFSQPEGNHLKISLEW
ncbi:MAG: hypothetical protein R3A13_11135 [Bdellovibrionota bacterium]